MKKNILFASLAGAGLLLQFFPIDRSLPAVRNEAQELHVVQPPPEAVMGILKDACYDCHSNHTHYPWYAYLQPVGWWIQGHVDEGRAELNFSEFGRYTPAERAEVLDHCASLIEKGKMPLKNYLPLHPEARLTAAQRQMLLRWLRNPQPAAANTSTAAFSDTCVGPDVDARCSFRDRPEHLSINMTITQPADLSTMLTIKGRMLHADGKTPYAGVLVYAYHTDESGHYTKKGDERGVQRWHGQYHGWCQTDAEGRYAIRSIRPASYPGRQEPAHIHAAVWPPDAAEPYNITDFVFADDPKVHPRELEKSARKMVGGTGIVSLQHTKEYGWTGYREVILK